MLWCGRLAAAVPSDLLVINSISVVETNLDFIATFPPSVDSAVLEMRSTLADEWQSAALLNVPADGGTIEFTIPKPALDMAFFRLNAAMRIPNNSRTNSPAHDHHHERGSLRAAICGGAAAGARLNEHQ
jgi:hypothetical protein